MEYKYSERTMEHYRRLCEEPPWFTRTIDRASNAMARSTQSLGYCVKLAFDALTSKPTGLQWRRNGEGDWTYIPVEITSRQDENGGWDGTHSYLDFPSTPYYVCVAWANGHHTPLPIVLGEAGGLQGALTRFFGRYPHLFSNWHTAVIDCAYYDHQFEQDEGPPRCARCGESPAWYRIEEVTRIFVSVCEKHFTHKEMKQ